MLAINECMLHTTLKPAGNESWEEKGGNRERVESKNEWEDAE